MRPLTTSEKFTLIRQYGQSISMTNTAPFSPRRSDILENAHRIIELTKSIPKIEFGNED